MSILVKISEQDNTNMLEITEGQYIYNQDKTIRCIDTDDNIYVDKRELHVEPSFMNLFYLNARTKLSIYDVNQYTDSSQYTGNVLIFMNYNLTNSAINRKLITLTANNYFKRLYSAVRYIVVERIDKSVCEKNLRQFKDGFDWKFIDAASHDYKNSYEPIIYTKSVFYNKFKSDNAAKTTAFIILAVIVFAYLFMKSYKSSYSKVADKLNETKDELTGDLLN